MTVKIDDTILSSFQESFRNRERLTSSITLSGSIPGGGHVPFSVDVPIVRNSAVFEVYYQRQGSFPRRRADLSSVLLDATWTHNIYIWVSSPSSGSLRITIDADNPGATDTITTQTFDFVIYVFDTPFSS